MYYILVQPLSILTTDDISMINNICKTYLLQMHYIFHIKWSVQGVNNSF